jgi:hypothetical protein
MQVTAGALTIWLLCTCTVHTCAPSLTHLYMCYEFLDSREGKLYFAYRFHVNIHIYIYTHFVKLVNEIGQNFYTIFEKDLSQILNKFRTWTFPVFWHSRSAAICTCIATLWLCAHHICRCPFQCLYPWWTGGWTFVLCLPTPEIIAEIVMWLTGEMLGRLIGCRGREKQPKTSHHYDQ